MKTLSHSPIPAFITGMVLFAQFAFSQNIGVNTDGSTPSTLLHTKNTIAGQHNYLRIENTQSGFQSAIQLLNSGTVGADWIWYIPGGTTEMRLYRAADLVTFLANGNVGIGTTTPGAKFHVSAGGQIIGTNGTSSNTRTLTILEDGDAQTNFGSYPGAWTSALQIQDNTTSRYLWLSPLDNASGANARLLANNTGLDFYTGANAYAATIASTGNVGISSTSPGARLDVVGPATGAGITIRAAGGGDVVLNSGGTLFFDGNYSYAGGNYIRPIGGANTQGFFTSGAERMRITSAGNVGIGNTGPGEKLDVTGNVRASGTAYWGSSGTRTETKNDAGGMGGRSGYYETSAPAPAANWPAGAGSWWHLLEARHSNIANNYAMQIAGSFFDQDVWVRKTNNTASTAWAKLLTTANYTSYGDNLGNHTATTNLNMSNFNIDAITYANIRAGNGYGVRFWGSDSYKINMGNAGEWAYGAVTGYSIKTNMNNDASRGWTWGVVGATPVASINTQGILSLANRIQIDGNTVIDDGGGWHRSYGATGWYNGTYDGGWYMSDGTWIRSYGSKNVYCDQVIRADGGFQVDGNQVIDADAGWHRTYGATGWYNGTYGSGFYMTDGSWVRNYCPSAAIGLDINGAGTFGGYNAPQRAMVGWYVGAEPLIAPSTANWGYVGSTANYWYQMYSRDYNAAGDYWYFSDESIKENIRPIKSALDKVLKLKGVIYDVKEDSYLFDNKDRERNYDRMGFIAQDFQKILPNAVREVEQEVSATSAGGVKKVDGTKLLTVSYSTAIPVLVEAMKEQQTIINELKKQNEDLNERIKILEKK